MYGRHLRVRGGLEQLTVLQAHVLTKCETLLIFVFLDIHCGDLVAKRLSGPRRGPIYDLPHGRAGSQTNSVRS
jgi:hypothetical protein